MNGSIQNSVLDRLGLSCPVHIEVEKLPPWVEATWATAQRSLEFRGTVGASDTCL